MASTRKLITTDSHGSGTAASFDDRTCIQDLNKATISRIVVRHDYHIRSLTVHYPDNVAITHGENTGTQSDVILVPGEYITTVKGTFSGGAISGLIFVTSKGTKWGPYGQSGGSSFTWSGFGPHMGLLYFSGKSDMYIRVLKATFAMYLNLEQPLRVVKYEKKVDPGPDAPQLVALSKFAQNLMSPTVTLIVGAEGIEFHASQSILCRLPFFHAALHGQFKEASDKKINMPEDEAEIVSALIEFLYTGSYTYTYRPKEGAESDTPSSDLAEGSFHVDVYAIASKYDCQQLVDASVRCFMYVMKQLTDIDVIRLWKTGYAKELLLSDWENDKDLVQFREGLGKLLKELYTTHREEMNGISLDYPALTNDLLRLVMSNSS